MKTRGSLLRDLQDPGNHTRWEEFDQLYRGFILRIAIHSGLTEAEAQDVTQDVFRGIVEKIGEFESSESRGKFRNWLKQLIRWRVADKFREREIRPGSPMVRRFETTTGTPLVNKFADPAPLNDADALWDKEWHAHLLDTALRALAQKVPAKQFQIFDLYKCKNWKVMDISRALKVNPATVYVVSHRLTKLLKTEIERVQARIERTATPS